MATNDPGFAPQPAGLASRPRLEDIPRSPNRANLLESIRQPVAAAEPSPIAALFEAAAEPDADEPVAEEPDADAPASPAELQDEDEL